MKTIMAEPQFDPLEKFAELERLVGKVYYRFSHLFLHHPELRDFWWQMALDEEHHSSMLLACKELMGRYPDGPLLDPSITREKAEELEAQISAYLGTGIPSISVDAAFRIALKIETSEIDAIYSKLLQLGGPEVIKVMESLGSPAGVQKEKLKSALYQFCKDPDLLRAAERL